MTAIMPWHGHRMVAVVIAGLLILTTLSISGQQKRTPENPQGKWEVLAGCTLSTNSLYDGDSFHVLHKGRTYIFRLYFVDAPEVDETLRDRITDQAAYFGIESTDIPRGGRLAAQFSLEKLREHKFTVETRWQNALGRSSLARFYCILRVKNENLAEELVANGLARIHGFRANSPHGTRSTTFINKLKNLELTAHERRLGLWDEKSFPHTTTATTSVPVKGVGKIQSGTVDINEASAEELQTLPGIGPKLAERIAANRPYRKVDDLLKVRGIGTNNLERFRARVRTEELEK
jgi:competence ComEA-like helix-hairpin-helix protein